MDNKTKLVAASGAAILGLLLIGKKAPAQNEYVCPYGDNLAFSTLVDLQEHVRTAHPGQAIPIDIQWQ